jgi:dienelactone hydrolase
MRSTWILAPALLWAASFATLLAQGPNTPLIERESLNFTGWDPDETVPAHVYYKKGNKAMPVVIFMHGMRGNKEQYPERMRAWAEKGMFVVAIDAHLHGGRKIVGVSPMGKNPGALGTDFNVWFHQSSVSHTARDVSKIIDALSARSDVDVSRIGVAGISMGSSTSMVLGWKEPRISVVVGMIGAVDFWYDMTKTRPGPEQDAKRKAFSPRVQELVSSIDPYPEERKRAFAPKALFLANGVRDEIDIESIRKFVKDLAPSYAAYPDRLKAIEEPGGHAVTDRMWSEGTKWLERHLVEKPAQASK